jgi:hypothetical protein
VRDKLQEPGNQQKEPQPLLGVRDFWKFISAGRPDWSLLALRASINSVAHAFAERHAIAVWERDVPIRRHGHGLSTLADQVMMVQLKSHPWSVVFQSIFRVTQQDIIGVSEDAQALAGSLQTVGLAFFGEATSGSMGYERFDVGESVESANWEIGNGFGMFQSKYREMPVAEAVDVEFADTVARNLRL